MIYYQLIRGTLESHQSIQDYSLPNKHRDAARYAAKTDASDRNTRWHTNDYRVIWRDTETHGKGYVV